MNSASSQLKIVDESTQQPEERDFAQKGHSLASNALIAILLIATMIAGYSVYFQDVSRLEAMSEASSSSSNRRKLLAFVDRYIGLQHPELSHPNLRYELDHVAGHNNRVILTDAPNTIKYTSVSIENAAKQEIFGQDEEIKWELSR